MGCLAVGIHMLSALHKSVFPHPAVAVKCLCGMTGARSARRRVYRPSPARNGCASLYTVVPLLDDAGLEDWLSVARRQALESTEHIAYHCSGPSSSFQNIHRRTSAYGDVPMQYGSMPVSNRSRRTR